MGKPRVRSIENQYTAAHERKEHNKKSHKKRLARRLTAFFIMAAVVSGVLISSMVTQASVLETKQNEKTQLEQKIVELDQQEENLRNEIVKLNDDEYIAKLARRDYFLSESGEIIFTIPEDQPAAKKEQNDTEE
ncbi:cell division protein DIVIC [Jeotgalibacillus malaysiensis]|uniref:Cell division protein DIVIC n=1 Tax=Jeotgalibacillus malaysiensis TaxID=1508404 RepID=A0A0B5AH51_9BACL|nr:septum formation initiator family protein [Jeotgalibacillus malaysiensis]AJD89396.1 cell division protein DIVIC [Jeotgalibacillus malaysiensis]